MALEQQHSQQSNIRAQTEAQRVVTTVQHHSNLTAALESTGQQYIQRITEQGKQVKASIQSEIVKATAIQQHVEENTLQIDLLNSKATKMENEVTRTRTQNNKGQDKVDHADIQTIKTSINDIKNDQCEHKATMNTSVQALQHRVSTMETKLGNYGTL